MSIKNFFLKNILLESWQLENVWHLLPYFTKMTSREAMDCMSEVNSYKSSRLPEEKMKIKCLCKGE